MEDLKVAWGSTVEATPRARDRRPPGCAQLEWTHLERLSITCVVARYLDYGESVQVDDDWSTSSSEAHPSPMISKQTRQKGGPHGAPWGFVSCPSCFEAIKRTADRVMRRYGTWY